MDTRFRNSEKSKTSDSDRLLLNLLDKINLKGSDKYIALKKIALRLKQRQDIILNF